MPLSPLCPLCGKQRTSNFLFYLKIHYMKKIYIECWEPSKEQFQKEYPNAIFVPNEGHLWTLGKGIQEALHNVRAPQQGENWKILSNGYYHSIVEVDE